MQGTLIGQRGALKGAPSAPQAPSTDRGMRRLAVTQAARDALLCPVSYTASGSAQQSMMSDAARSAFRALERDSTAAIARSRAASSLHATASAASATHAAGSAIDTLCLVTYSDDEETPVPCWTHQQQQQHLQPQHQQQQRPMAVAAQPVYSGSMAAAAAAARADTARAGAVFAALSSNDNGSAADALARSSSDVPGVMETLCILSYDEEAE